MMQTARCILFFCFVFVFFFLFVFVFVFFPPLFLWQAILTFIFLLLQLHLRYQLEELPSKSKECNVQVFFGIEWLKSSKHQKRITKNIQKNLQDRLKGIFSVIEKEFVARQWSDLLHFVFRYNDFGLEIAEVRIASPTQCSVCDDICECLLRWRLKLDCMTGHNFSLQKCPLALIYDSIAALIYSRISLIWQKQNTQMELFTCGA